MINNLQEICETIEKEKVITDKGEYPTIKSPLFYIPAGETIDVTAKSNVNLFSLQFFNGCKVMCFFRKKQDFC